MIEPDHLPFVDSDGWLLPGAQMSTDSLFKNYNGPQRPFIGHDGNMYICLDEGDIIQPGDYILNEKHGWVLAKNCFGEKAPNPCFTSHRQYRRRVYPPNVGDQPAGASAPGQAQTNPDARSAASPCWADFPSQEK